MSTPIQITKMGRGNVAKFLVLLCRSHEHLWFQTSFVYDFCGFVVLWTLCGVGREVNIARTMKRKSDFKCIGIHCFSILFVCGVVWVWIICFRVDMHSSIFVFPFHLREMKAHVKTNSELEEPILRCFKQLKAKDGWQIKFSNISQMNSQT